MLLGKALRGVFVDNDIIAQGFSLYKEKSMEKEILKERLAAYLEAEKKLLSGAQFYKIADRELRRADLAEIRRAIDDLSAQINLFDPIKGGRRKRAVFID